MLYSVSEDGTLAKLLDKALTFMIAKDNMALSVTEREGFRYFMKLANRKYNIPKRHKITNLVEKMYNEVALKVKKKLAGVESVAITTDMWTESMNKYCFTGVTVHYLEEFELKSFVLGMYLDALITHSRN